MLAQEAQPIEAPVVQHMLVLVALAMQDRAERLTPVQEVLLIQVLEDRCIAAQEGMRMVALVDQRTPVREVPVIVVRAALAMLALAAEALVVRASVANEQTSSSFAAPASPVQTL